METAGELVDQHQEIVPIVVDPEWSYTNAGGNFCPDVNALEAARSYSGEVVHFFSDEETAPTRTLDDWKAKEMAFIEQIVQEVRSRPQGERVVYIRITDQFAARSVYIANALRQFVPDALIFGGGSVPMKVAKKEINIDHALCGSEAISPFDAYNVDPEIHQIIAQNLAQKKPWNEGLSIDPTTKSMEGHPLIHAEHAVYGNHDPLQVSLDRIGRRVGHGVRLIYPTRMTIGCPWVKVCSVPCTDIEYRPDDDAGPHQLQQKSMRKQLETAAEYNPDGILFLDLSFAFNQHMLKQVDLMMPDSLRTAPKTCYANAYDFRLSRDDRPGKGVGSLPLLKKIGVRNIFTGLERWDSSKLKLLGNEASIRETSAALREHGINVVAGWIIGWPGETWEEAQKTVTAARKMAEYGFKPAPQALDTRELFHPLASHLMANGSLDVPLNEVALRVWQTMGGHLDFRRHTAESVLPSLLIAGLDPSDLPETQFGNSAMTVRQVALCLREMLDINGHQKLNVLTGNSGNEKQFPEVISKSELERVKQNFINNDYLFLKYGTHFITHYGPLTDDQKRSAEAVTAADIRAAVLNIFGKDLPFEELISHMQIEAHNGIHTESIGIMPLKAFRAEEGETFTYRGRTIPNLLYREVIEKQMTDGLIFTANVVNSEGKKVGYMSMGVTKDRDGKRTYHELTVRITDPDARVNHFKTAQHKKGLDFSRRHGLDRVMVDAADGGVYFACRYFNFPEEKYQEEARQFKADIESHPQFEQTPPLQRITHVLGEVSESDYFLHRVRDSVLEFCRTHGVSLLDEDDNEMTPIEAETHIRSLTRAFDFCELKGNKKFKLKFSDGRGELMSLEESPDGTEVGRAALLSFTKRSQENGKYDGIIGIIEL